MEPHLTCPTCEHPPEPLDWRCTNCGGALEISDLPPFEAEKVRRDDWSVWRYADMLPVEQRMTLGAGCTPLLKTAHDGVNVYAKCEHLNPTGSYKDRGTETLVNYLLSHGVKDVVEDSSGNAGSSLAFYAAAAGMNARIFVPANAPDGKKRAIAAAAELAEIPGPRQAVTDAVLAAATGAVVYASHSWNPYFILGQQTMAWEIWEQLAEHAPAAVVAPVGQGGLLLGLARGFRALHAAGLIPAPPRLYGVQAAACDPVVRAFEAGAAEPVSVTPSPSAADGVMIGMPVRGRMVLDAIRESNGAAIRVAENAIFPAKAALAKLGFYVEPTSALTYAALPEVRRLLEQDGLENPQIVLILTGHGLKSTV